jgi:aryl-alcohol dehydrogenase-like predicted oxidoreductase
MSATPVLDWSKTKMKYRHLGRSGLKVSCLSLGTWSTVGMQSSIANILDHC